MSARSRGTHEQMEIQYEAAKRNLELVRMIPEEDDYPVGTVIRWKKEGHHPRVAFKFYTSHWQLTQYNNNAEWATVVNHIKGGHDRNFEYLEIAVAWRDIRVKQPPELDLTNEDGDNPEPGRFVLTDTHTDTTWVREGDQWVREGEV